MSDLPSASSQSLVLKVSPPISPSLHQTLIGGTKNYLEVLRRMKNAKIFYNYQVEGDLNRTTISALIQPPYFAFNFFPNKKSFLSANLELVGHSAPKSLSRTVVQLRMNTLLLVPWVHHPLFPSYSDLLLEQFDQNSCKVTTSFPVFWRLSRFGFHGKLGVKTQGASMRVGLTWNHLYPGLYLSLYKKSAPIAFFPFNIDTNYAVLRSKLVMGKSVDREASHGSRGVFKFYVTPFVMGQQTRFRLSLDTFQWVHNLSGIPLLNFSVESRTNLSNVWVRDFANLRGFPFDLNRNRNPVADVMPGQPFKAVFRSYASLKWTPISHDFSKSSKLNIFGFGSAYVHDLSYLLYEYGFGFDTPLSKECNFEFLYNVEGKRAQIRFTKF